MQLDVRGPRFAAAGDHARPRRRARHRQRLARCSPRPSCSRSARSTPLRAVRLALPYVGRAHGSARRASSSRPSRSGSPRASASRSSAVASVAYLSGAQVVGLVATGFALAAAFLNAAFGLCLGCEAYLLLRRSRRTDPVHRDDAPIRSSGLTAAGPKPASAGGGGAGSMAWNAPRLRAVLPGGGQPRRPVRRLVRHLRHVDRDLLPPVLPGA